MSANLNCSNQGWGAILQHMKTSGHIEKIKLLKNNSTFFIESSKTQTSSTDDVVATPQLRLSNMKRPIVLDFQEQVTKAEAVWALTVAQRGYSFNSCDDIGDVFRHATAAVLKTAILDSLKSNGLELKQLLMLGRDSPFVNLSLENLIENEMKKIGCGLLKIGGCHLHVAHNGFKAGLSSSD
ncbi:unnamed protein product [Rotaria sp. Silwood2]|nr:unnamed protein product [Rotaria sp. Silwood2]